MWLCYGFEVSLTDHTTGHAEMEKTDLPSEYKGALSEAQEEQMYSDNGVDLTLIRWMLSLTPTERLQALQQSVQSLMRLRDESSVT